MTSERRTDGTDSGGNSRTVSRRRFLGVATGVAGAAASFPAFVGGAAAQEETTDAGDDAGTDDPNDSPEPVTTQAALPTDAPTFEQSDYTGLFLQVTGRDREADSSGVRECGFVGSDEDITGFDARIFETTEERPAEQTTIFAVTQRTTIESGLVFVINSQEECSSEFVNVGIEEVEASSVGTPTPEGGGGGVPSGGAIPGFDAVAGVLGVGAAAAAAALRSRGEE